MHHYCRGLKGAEMKYLSAIFLFLFLIWIAGCSEDENPTTVSGAPTEPLYFAIYATPLGGIDGSVIRFEFFMEFSDEIPIVEANGKTIEVFYFEGAGINGYLNLPMSAKIDFSVTSGTKIISGSINMPTRVDEVSCNGVMLQDDTGNVLDSSNTYQFEWTGGEADYFVCFLEMWDEGSGITPFWDETLTNNWTVDVETGNPANFEVIAVNGSGLGPGASPYITSTWANGYVSALAVPNRFYFSLNYVQYEILNGLSARSLLMGHIHNH